MAVARDSLVSRTDRHYEIATMTSQPEAAQNAVKRRDLPYPSPVFGGGGAVIRRRRGVLSEVQSALKPEAAITGPHLASSSLRIFASRSGP